MDKDNMEYNIANLETMSNELIRFVLYVCETELAKHNDDIKGLPSAAMAVRESILTFMALVRQK